jgi:RNA polymerase sigma factor (sigma-70 family)
VTTPARDPERFTELYRLNAGRVFAYAYRQSDVAVAEDIVAETFLTAWRRRGDVPDDALPWLLVTARNLLANHRRRLARGEATRLELQARHRVAAHQSSVDEFVIDREEMLRALASLRPKDQEALLLIAWDGLTPQVAARVAGCSQSAFEVRLHRARRRLHDAVPPIQQQHHHHEELQ